MNVTKTLSGRPHRNGRDWPYSTYLTICKLHEQGELPSTIASRVKLTAAQVAGFLDSCWLSPTGGYAELKRRIEADLDAQGGV